MTREEITDLAISALLHDIGKFKQRARFVEDKGKNHSTIGYEWLSSHYGESLIAAGARNHHGYEDETWESNYSLLIYEADNLSASERRKFDPLTDIDKSWHHEILLASEFSRIIPDSGEPVEMPNPRYWPLQSIGGWVAPGIQDRGGSPEHYRNMWEAFEKDFGLLKKEGRHKDVEILLHLMERYTSFIPSITLYIEGASDRESFKKHPDVSLFDHSKVTAAAAVCLYHYYSTNYRDRWNRQVLKDEITAGWSETTQEPFILVGGDLSGVQNFIYTISSSGALKSLKGRSFFLELLTEHLVDMLVERLKLTRCNVLFTGGGHFYLLAANTEDAKKDIERLSHELDEYLWGSYNGSLGCCLAYVSMGKGAFRDATRSWRELSEKIEFMKRRKWEDRLNKVLGPPESPHSDWLSSQCEVCAREDVPRRVIREVNMCPTCEEQFLFGEELQKACREASRNPGTFVCVGVWEGEASWEGNGVLTISVGRKRSYKPFYSKKNTDRPNGVTWVYRLNDWNVENYKAFGDRPLLAGTYHASEFEDLESLVEQGYGWNRAGVLRMDVDNLGKIFSQWVREEDRTFSRMASLSRQFSLFFKYHLNGILDLRRGDGYESIQRVRLAAKNRGDERLLSIVYSGGDDVFIIGHWLDVLEAAYDIHAAFTAMVGNPNVTLSAGLALAAHHYPIYRFARDAGEAEKKAKKAGRNSLTVVGRTFPWKAAREIADVVINEIIPLVGEGRGAFGIPPGSLSKGFFYKVLSLLGKLEEKGKGGLFWVLPKIAYLVGRGGPSHEFIKQHPERTRAWADLKNRLMTQPEQAQLDILYGSVVWTMMLIRKGENRDESPRKN